jgi:hypothetical protein
LAIVPIKFSINRKKIVGATSTPVQKPKNYNNNGSDWGNGGSGTGRESFREQVISQGEGWREKYEKIILENYFNMTKTSTKTTKKDDKITKTFVVRSSPRTSSPIKSLMGTPTPTKLMPTPTKSSTGSLSPVRSLSRSLSQMISPSKTVSPAKTPSKMPAHDAKNIETIESEKKFNKNGGSDVGGSKTFDTFTQFKKYIIDLDTQMEKKKTSSMYKKIKIREYPKYTITTMSKIMVSKIKATGEIIKTYMELSFFVSSRTKEFYIPDKMSNRIVFSRKLGGKSDMVAVEHLLRELENALKQ